MRVRRIFQIASTLLLSVPGLATPVGAQKYEGRQLVQPELIANTDAIVPGKSFAVGLVLRMAPHWHTYWKYSGDAGLPTEIKWNLPSGWRVGEVQWPIPLKTNDPGDIETYGYENEVMLMQEIIAPTTLDGQTIQLSADADWLVCEKICIPGSASLSLVLPRSNAAHPANTEIFDRYGKLLPQPWPAGNVATAEWRRGGANLSLTIKSDAIAASPAVDFFPTPPSNIVVGHPAVESRTKNQITFKIPVPAADKSLSSLSGLLVFASHPNADDRRGWTISGNTEPVSASQPVVGRSLLTYLFFGFIGGFILNLMPCVLPVISLKIFGFIRQAGQDRRKILRSGVAFTAGIFGWFVALALVLIALKAAGRAATWGGFQFTNPYFVLGLSVLVLVFALNLFGVFEISLPHSITGGILSRADRKDDLGSFFQGVFATVLATPCTAPFLGTALGFAFTQSPLIILSMFTAVAAGMSAPYLLLSAQPAWLRFLPKPGGWMLHVKQFMGFLLLATLLFLLYVLGAQRGLDGAIWASCFLLVIAVACWMKGAFVLPATPGPTRASIFLFMVLLVLGSGAYFIADKFRTAKPDLAQRSSQSDWQPFTPERLQTERDQGHAVFVDFTAAWCLTCKFNEKTVLESESVRDAFLRHGIVKLKADWTNGDPAITKLLQQFGRPGVPLYVLYPGKAEEPIVFPELLTKSLLLDKLETINTVAGLVSPGGEDAFANRAARDRTGLPHQ